MDIIHVGLYGGKSIFGGREQPLDADIIYCDKYEKCSYYQNHQCFKIRSFGRYCKFGKVQNVKGYTSRARKYYAFKQKWREHEKYNKLKLASDKLGLIDDTVVLPYPHLALHEEDGLYFFKREPFGCANIHFIPIEKFTVDFIKKICEYRPYAVFGGEIRDYQNKYVPLFLAHLKELMPEKYDEFIKAYPEFDKNIDHRGRKAILKTVKPSLVHYKSKNYPNLNETWYWDGEYLTYKNGYLSSVNVIRDYEVINLKIKPSDKAMIEIHDNKQISKDTVFVD